MCFVSFQGLVQILGGIDNLGIKPKAATGLIKGVALVLSRLPHENIKAVMKALCAIQLGPLQALLEQHSPQATGQSTVGPILNLAPFFPTFQHMLFSLVDKIFLLKSLVNLKCAFCPCAEQPSLY